MALKYFLEYQDVIDINHRWELYDDAFIDTPIEIQGRVFLDAAGADNPLEAIRGIGLRVELEANTLLTFDDLFTEEQRSFQVAYLRNSITKFNGWLNPEGWFEDYVTDKWKVSFDCVDGLGFLDSLSYVDDSGLFFTGKQSLLGVISNCLKRTGIQQNINTNIDIHYDNLGSVLDVLDNVFTISERFIKDDGDTIMSCEEVLRSVLEPFAACITTLNGEWFIYKPNQLFLDTEITYFRYSYLGVALAPTTATVDTALPLGSQINGFSPHHCSGNQSIRNANSIGAYRISYKYGLVISLIDNNLFFSSNGTSWDDWNIIDATYITFPITEFGVDFDVVEVTDVIALESDPITLTVDTILDFVFKIETLLNDDYGAVFKWQVELDDDSSGDFYYMRFDGVWVLNDSTVLFGISLVGVLFSLILQII